MICSPDMAAILLLAADPTLADLHQGRVSSDLQPGGPALRVTLLPGSETTNDYEWPADVQVDCFADDQAQAADLAAAVRAVWPCYEPRHLPDLDAWVSSTWLVSNPMAIYDPDTGRWHYMLTVALRVHEVPQ